MLEKREWVLIVGAVLVLLIGLFSTFGMGYQISMDGRIIGYTKDTKAFTDSVTRIDDIMKAAYGVDTAKVSDEFKIQHVPVFDKVESSVSDFTRELIAKDHDVSVSGVAMSIDGKAAGNFVSEKQAQEALEAAVKTSAAVGENDRIVGYQIHSNITYQDKTFDVTEVRPTKEWGTLLAAGQSASEAATVQTVASAGTGQQVNRGAMTALDNVVEAESVQPEGEETPVLKMDVTKQSVIKEAIPYDVVRQEDSSLYVGQIQIRQPGQAGVREHVVESQYVDGVVTTQTQLSETVTKEPVAQIIAVGNNTYPTMGAKKGDFILPAAGDVTSTDKSGSHAGYKAIDIAAAQGTPIYAPKDGTVTMAQEYGSYGLTVQVEADDGTVFLMAHNSEFKCSAGDRVSKGQVIALMGSTGNSTGPHCHFEIRIGGTQQCMTDYFDLGLGDIV
ncbi:MAG: peptidoglycan DD-metalloendopeptidase family protein [Eubacterium aggregans]|nr:peptidoglycan DD-metalloendopeptidase family protein [Eubacterium aggregans]